MVKISENMAIYAGLGVIVPAAEGLLNADIVKLGHTFNLLTKTGLLQAGLFGAIQGCAANLIFLKILRSLKTGNATPGVYPAIFF